MLSTLWSSPPLPHMTLNLGVNHGNFWPAGVRSQGGSEARDPPLTPNSLEPLEKFGSDPTQTLTNRG